MESKIKKRIKCWDKLINNKTIKSYVKNAYNIFMGSPDYNLLKKSKSLDSISELSKLQELGDIMFSDFVGAVHDENHFQLKEPFTLDRSSHYHTLKAWRYKILIDMFERYQLIYKGKNG